MILFIYNSIVLLNKNSGNKQSSDCHSDGSCIRVLCILLHLSDHPCPEAFAQSAAAGSII